MSLQFSRAPFALVRRVALRPVDRAPWRSALLAVFLVAAGTQGCGGGEPTGPDTGHDAVPTELRLSADSVIVPQLGTAQVNVTVADAGGAALSGYAPSFASADTALVKVAADGRITSVGPQGRTQLTVQAAGLSRQVPVIVTAVPTRIDVTPAAITLTQKDSAQLIVQVYDATGAALPAGLVTYAPTGSGVLATRPTGIVVSLGPAAPAQVQVWAGPLTKTVPVTIVQQPAAVVLTPGGMVQVPQQSTKQFTAQVRDLNGDPVQGAAVAWATGSALASVSATGLVTASNTPGSVTLTATYHHDTVGDLVGSATVFVTQTAPPAAVVPADLVSINTGRAPSDAAVAPSGKVIAVSGEGTCCSAAVWTADLATFSGVTTLGTGGSPLTVRLNDAGSLAYIAGAEPGPGQGWGVGVLDVASETQVGYLEHGSLGQPYSVGLSRDGQRVVMGTSLGNLVIFDAATGAWRKTLTFSGALFNHITAHPTQPKMYASAFPNGFDHPGVVVEIDLAAETMRTLALPPAKYQGVAVSPDGAQLFVADENGPLQVWDLTTNRSAGSIPAASSGFGLTLSPDGTTLYQVDGRVLAIDVATHVVTRNYDIPGALRAGISADGTKLVVAGGNGRLYRFTP